MPLVFTAPLTSLHTQPWSQLRPKPENRHHSFLHQHLIDLQRTLLCDHEEQWIMADSLRTCCWFIKVYFSIPWQAVAAAAERSAPWGKARWWNLSDLIYSYATACKEVAESIYIWIFLGLDIGGMKGLLTKKKKKKVNTPGLSFDSGRGV